jgi:purine-nucleoside phosphorylase
MASASRENERVDAVAQWLLANVRESPRVGLILGSGLGPLADRMGEYTVRVPYRDCPELPQTTVPGHQGMLVAGQIGGVHCAIMQGRFHLYEGYDAATVALPARALVRAGIRTLIVTNSAGGIDRTFKAGDLMLIDDHINLQAANPLTGPVLPGETRFPDMSSPYDAQCMQLAEQAAMEERIRVVRGVYCAVLGPSYETCAEIRMLARMGASAVGMSTVPEVLVARAAGVRVLGISVITNLAAGLTTEPLRHEDVIERGRAAADSLARLLVRVIERLPA